MCSINFRLQVIRTEGDCNKWQGNNLIRRFLYQISSYRSTVHFKIGKCIAGESIAPVFSLAPSPPHLSLSLALSLSLCIISICCNKYIISVFRIIFIVHCVCRHSYNISNVTHLIFVLYFNSTLKQWPHIYYLLVHLVAMNIRFILAHILVHFQCSQWDIIQLTS